MRAFEGWGQIHSVEEWQATCEDAAKRYRSGRFLLERLGAERFLDPQLMATLWQFRQGLLEEYGAASPTVTLFVDLALMAYANALRVQGRMGDLALVIDHELFAEDSLKVKLRQQYGLRSAIARRILLFDGFAVEEQLRRLREQVLPLFERVNRQLLQNLQGLQRGHPASSPMVAIGQARNVNVAQQQVHIQRRDGRSSQPVEPR